MTGVDASWRAEVSSGAVCGGCVEVRGFNLTGPYVCASSDCYKTLSGEAGNILVFAGKSLQPPRFRVAMGVVKGHFCHLI